MLLIHVVTLVLLVYTLWRIVLPLPCGVGWRCLVGALTLVAGLKLQCFQWLFGSMASPEMPWALMLIWSWAHGACMLFVLLAVSRDILLGLRWLWRRLWSAPGSAKLAKASTYAGVQPDASQAFPYTSSSPCAAIGPLLRHWYVPALLFACLCAAWGEWQACRVPEVHTVSVRSSRLPSALSGLRVVHLSDLHVSALMRRSWVESVVARVNALQPDVIVITGDIVDGTVQARAEDIAPLANLQARYGVWICVGNHEYYSDWSGWRRALPELGLRVLDNRHVLLHLRGEKLALLGVTDAVARRWPERGLAQPDVQTAMRGVPPEVFRILLAHRPTEAFAAARAGVDLQLSGHTHGGQMWGLRWLVARMNQGFRQGLYTVGDMTLYVSPGTGLWPGFPLRLGTSAEITELLLHKNDL